MCLYNSINVKKSNISQYIFFMRRRGRRKRRKRRERRMKGKGGRGKEEEVAVPVVPGAF